MKTHTKQLGTFLFAVAVLSTAISLSSARDQSARPAPKSLPGSHPEIYKKIGDVELPIHIFKPINHQPKDKCPAIVFFFGGGWRGGSPAQFQNQCRYLASRGMVAMTAEYRVLNRHGVKAVSCFRDAKSAIRWVRQNAERLGIDPDRIAAGGGSAGGHLAGALGTIREFDEQDEDVSISSVPNALVLFNPALVLAPVKGYESKNMEKLADMEERLGVKPERLSPYHHIREGLPTTIIFHGKADTTVPYFTSEMFAQEAQRKGNRCELVGYDGQSHGFFNYGRSQNKYFIDTVKRMDAFLISLGYLNGPATIEDFMRETSLIELGQGQMAGRVTETSVILQSRLTQGMKLINGDLPGSQGTARFEIADNPEFRESHKTRWIEASPDYDYIIKTKMDGLKPSTKYYYRLLYGPERDDVEKAPTCSFKTLGGKNAVQETKFAVVTGMNYFFFHEGPYRPEGAYQGADKNLGYPGLEAIRKLKPDFFVGTGDNVYFDHPAKSANSNRWTGTAWSDRAKTASEMRRKFHEQFVQPRYVTLFAEVPTYWEVDDHDYRYDDCDNTGDRMPTPEMGRRNFREQLPVVDPADSAALTYATFRINRDLQIWLLEGRCYRSPNKMPDGPDKSIWGKTQKQWLKDTLLASDATFKILISPTPLVGPDDRRKTDNHTNINGFRYEGQEFFNWLKEHGFLDKHFYIICGDRHWQYHARHPSGFEEFSCGALVDANSRLGVKAGSPKSTDPEGKIQQFYCQLEGQPSGGFLMVTVSPVSGGATARFDFYDEHGRSTYSHTKHAE